MDSGFLQIDGKGALNVKMDSGFVQIDGKGALNGEMDSGFVQTGFPLMDVLLKLEHSDRIRHNGLTCSVCAYSIIGLRYREVHVHFNLCSMCYSEGKVPAQYKREDYVFKEFSTETSGSFDKLFNFGTKSNQSSSSGQSGSRGAVPVNVH